MSPLLQVTDRSPSHLYNRIPNLDLHHQIGIIEKQMVRTAITVISSRQSMWVTDKQQRTKRVRACDGCAGLYCTFSCAYELFDNEAGAAGAKTALEEQDETKESEGSSGDSDDNNENDVKARDGGEHGEGGDNA